MSATARPGSNGTLPSEEGCSASCFASSSPLLEDDTLSRLTDAEIKAIMIHATRTLAMMLRLRDEAPEVYRRHLQQFGSTYCRAWERSG